MRKAVGLTFVAFIIIAPLYGANDKQEKGAVRFRVTIPEQSLRFTTSTIPADKGSLKIAKVQLTGDEGSFSPTEPGVPDLPYVDRFVALPPGAVVKEIAFEPVKTLVAQGITLVTWTQPANPAQKQRDPREPFFAKGLEFFPSGDAMPPHPEFMKRPQWPVDLVKADPPIESIEDANIVRVRVSPIAWAPQKATLTFNPVVDVEVRYTIDKAPKKAPKKAVFADVMLREELRGLVENPALIPSLDFPRLTRIDAPYLIITDNFRWSETATKGTALDGDLVAEFQRLADWKTRRGLKAKVVTISDIMAGTYGDYRTGSADLQEVIRRFLKMARRSWNTAWVLLGGSENLIPPRMVLSMGWVNAAFLLAGDAAAEPPPGRFHFHAASHTVRIHSPALVANPTVEIFSARDSTRFRKVASPTATRPGWFFVTDATYATASLVPTEFAVLRGPAADIEGTHFYMALKENIVPTDLYYASLDDDLYDRPGLRDWDANGDGHYGQHAEGTSVDGVSWYPDVALGRAPVETIAGARAFINRVMFYERASWRFESPTTRALMTSTNWGASGPSADRLRSSFETLRAGEYRTRRNGPGVDADVYFGGRLDSVGRSTLVVRNTFDGTWRIIPYRRLASMSDPGFYFTTDETFATRSETPIEIFGITFLLPLPTRFVKIFSEAGETFAAASFFFDDFELDSSVQQQEDMIALIQRAAPGIMTFSRKYEDWFDLDPPNPAWGFDPVDVVLDLRDNAYNIVSSAGHGNPSTCCGFWNFSDVRGEPSGLMYVDSCLTNSFEDPRGSMSEAFLNHSLTEGGVTAYIGSTRYSWIGVGADLERVFWGRFAHASNIATLHNTKAAHVTSGVTAWAHYSINLMGDPSMNLWRGEPVPLTLEAPATLGTGSRLRVRVTGPAGPLFATRVALTGPDTFETILTGLDGWAEFAPLGLSAGTLTVMAAPSGYLPAEATVTMVPGR